MVASIPSTAIVSRSGAWKASNQIAAPPKPKPLETLYPVSAGLQHHDNQTVDGGSCSGCVPVQVGFMVCVNYVVKCVVISNGPSSRHNSYQGFRRFNDPGPQAPG